MSPQAVLANFRGIRLSGLGVPALLLALLAMMVVPLAPIVLDVLFTFNIALSMVVILAAIYSRRPLDFAVFPIVLLVTTLLRLALNIASTRVVLLEGHTGTDAAGQVIEAFGAFVIGGNYAVGLVVFAILVIINFVVVTKGAGRIAEVSARFTLDAMPGKQMAIDADLNSGLLSQDEARIRRKDVADEADFYGAMDGASKFVRGDAVAGILILFINIIGGLFIGMLQHNLSFETALQNYALLTIGDGLVAQIPSLMLSSAAALMVTRVSSAQDVGGQVIQQLFDNPKTLLIAAGIVGAMGLVPGMPNLAFLTLAALAGGSGFYMLRQQGEAQAAAVEHTPELPTAAPKELSWDDVPSIDPLGLEVGYRLIPLVDTAQNGQLMGRIKGVRKKLSKELGFLVPPVHIRDNLELAPDSYRLSLKGVTVGEGRIHPERELAINPGQVFGELYGEAGVDPVFGLEAVWIDSGQRDQAQTYGYTVVDASTVIATHLSHAIQEHAHELLGHEEVQQLLDRLQERTPKLVEQLEPEKLPPASLVRVLQNLLSEGVPIRDTRTIAETLAEHAARSQDPDVLTAAVRRSLGRLIVQNINDLRSELSVITIDPGLDRLLQDSLQAGGGEGAMLEPGLSERLQWALQEATQKQETSGDPAVLLVPDPLRLMLARFARAGSGGLRVLSYGEVPDEIKVRVIAAVGGDSQAAAALH